MSNPFEKKHINRKLPFIRSSEFLNICRVFSNSRYFINIYFVTSNLTKISHYQHLFSLYNLPLKVYDQVIQSYSEDYSLEPDSAIKYSLSEISNKLRHLGLFFIDDSSLVLNSLSLNGKEFPGLATKEFLKKNNFNDIDKLLKSYENDRRASLISRIGLHLPGEFGSEVFTGIINGVIASEFKNSRTTTGVPWKDEKSPANFFIPNGKGIPLSELPLEVSYDYDSRLRALHKMLFRLAQCLSISENISTSYLKKQTIDYEKQARLFEPQVIIFAGYSGAGKTTAALYLSRKYHINYFEQSDAIRSAASDDNWPLWDTSNYCNNKIEKEGALYFIRYLLNMHRDSLDLPFVLSGMRNPHEAAYLRSIFPNSILIFLDVPFELRFARRCIVGISHPDKKDEFEALQDQERIWGIESIRKNADILLPNIGNIQKLYNDIDRILKKSS